MAGRAPASAQSAAQTTTVRSRPLTRLTMDSSLTTWDPAPDTGSDASRTTGLKYDDRIVYCDREKNASIASRSWTMGAAGSESRKRRP